MSGTVIRKPLRPRPSRASSGSQADPRISNLWREQVSWFTQAGVFHMPDRTRDRVSDAVFPAAYSSNRLLTRRSRGRPATDVTDSRFKLAYSGRSKLGVVGVTGFDLRPLRPEARSVSRRGRELSVNSVHRGVPECTGRRPGSHSVGHSAASSRIPRKLRMKTCSRRRIRLWTNTDEAAGVPQVTLVATARTFLT